MKRKLNHKRSQSELLTAIVSLIILGSSILVGTNLSMNGSVTGIDNIQFNNTLQKTVDIEVWADTIIGIEENLGSINISLLFDNKTIIPEQEIEFYLDEFLIGTEITNSYGNIQPNFNLFEKSPGTYFFKAEFQGNPSLYLNPSSKESQLEIEEVNGTKQIKLKSIQKNITTSLNETNITLMSNETLMHDLNQTLLTINTNKNSYTQNETIDIFGEIVINGERVYKEIKIEIELNNTLILSAKVNSINGTYEYLLIADFESEGEYLIRVLTDNLSAETSFYLITNIIDLKGFVCEEFQDDVLFSSGYTLDKKGSTNYEIWEIQTNCTEAGGQDCSLYNVNTKSRILYSNPYNEEIAGESYVQISELDESNCNNPEKEEYSKYIVHDIPKQEGGKWERYCEKNKTPDSKCEIENSENYYEESTCYGIKTYASQYSIVDVVEIKYTWCWKTGGLNE